MINKWFDGPITNNVVFCFHHSGGSSAFYNGWKNLLPSIQVVPVCLPGRIHRCTEPLLDDMETLVDQLVDVFKLLQLENFALFGHSLGGLVAYALSLRLERAKLSPTLTCISSALPFSLRKKNVHTHLLTDQELLEKIKQYRGMQGAQLEDRSLQAYMLPIIRADFKICEDYVPDLSSKLQTKVCVLYGNKDNELTQSDFNKWNQLLNKAPEIYEFEGGHFYLEEHKKLILEIIDKHLNKR